MASSLRGHEESQSPKGKAHGAGQNFSAESENGADSENLPESMASKGKSHKGEAHGVGLSVEAANQKDDESSWQKINRKKFNKSWVDSYLEEEGNDGIVVDPKTKSIISGPPKPAHGVGHEQRKKRRVVIPHDLERFEGFPRNLGQ